jgi:ribosomal protein S18 acetylase RimI-like enzyme
MRLEPGRLDDAREAARLIAETDRGLFRYCGGGSLDLWVDLATHEWRHEHGVYSHTLSHVVRAGGGLEGLLIGYTAERHGLIDWRFSGATAHLDPQVIGRIRTMFGTVAFLFPAIPEEAYYIQNVAVAEEARGRGLGRFLMESAFDLGRAAGCRACHLDVDSSTSAVAFYQHLGMDALVETFVPRLPGVSAHYRMVKEL